MSRFSVLAFAFVVCTSLFFTALAQQKQQQNIQQHPPPPPPPQQQGGQQQYSKFNQNNGNNQQKKQDNLLQNTKQTQQQPQVTQSNLIKPVNQNDRVPNRRVRPSIVDAAAAALKRRRERKSKFHLMKEFLHAHNMARMKYNLKPFTWDMNLEKFARQWGSKRFLDCKMIHSYGPYGENVFWGYQEHWTNSQAVQHWVEESQYYDSSQNSCAPQKVCGHFTQVVWSDSLRVGCARQKCNNGSLLVICEYDPPGNYFNEHPLKKNI